MLYPCLSAPEILKHISRTKKGVITDIEHLYIDVTVIYPKKETEISFPGKNSVLEIKINVKPMDVNITEINERYRSIIIYFFLSDEHI